MSVRLSGFAVALCALPILLSLGGCDKPSGAAAMPEPRPMRVTTVHLEPAVETSRWPAVLRPRIEVDLGFRVGGKVITRLVDVGDRVDAGTPLAKLDTADLELAVKASRARLASAKADAENARAEYERYVLLPTLKHHGETDVYSGPMYRALRGLITACARFRWLIIPVTVAAFGLSIFGFKLVQRQFFPSSRRPELLVDIRLAEGSSYGATLTETGKLEKILGEDKENVESWVAYTGGGSPRFILTLDQRLQNSNFAQFAVLTKGLEQREALFKKLESKAEKWFPAARVRLGRLELGPPVGLSRAVPRDGRGSGDLAEDRLSDPRRDAGEPAPDRHQSRLGRVGQARAPGGRHQQPTPSG